MANKLPIDRKKFREEINARLKELHNPKLAIAFAARMAAIALPMLAHRTEEKGFLWYWREEEREKHLLAVLRAVQTAWADSLIPDIITRANAVVDAYAAAADAAAADAADAAYAASAADAAAYAADAAAADDDALMDIIWRELDSLSRDSETSVYLNHPYAPPPLSPLQEQFLARLRQLPSFEYWADWLQDRYAGRPWDPEILKKSIGLPEEIENRGPRAVNRYLKELAAGELEAGIKRVRAIFIGNGDAGKTSLIRALNGLEVKEGGTDMTCGIDISEWQVTGTDLKAHFWDFGGQVIAHATHQFFLRARCVYVLVINARSTDSNPNRQAEYWLEFVRAYGGDAPVLLVGNKCDLGLVPLDVNRLKESYPNIVPTLHALSATRYCEEFADEFSWFKKAFIAELAKAGESQPYFSAKRFAVIEALRQESRRDPFLSKRVFDELCQQQGIETGEREEFLQLLDQLGEIIYFPELYALHGFSDFLLNPRWLTYGIYQLLYSDLLKRQQGELHWGDVRELLKDKKIRDERGNILTYPGGKLDFLIRAMVEFKLCYPAPDAPDRKWIVPDLLPSDQPKKIDFDDREALRFDFRFETLLPRHVLNTFMVEHYRDIRGNQAWQHGVCLASHTWQSTEALVRANYQKRVLSLAVNGPHADRYFSGLYESILKILERMPRLKYVKLFYLSEAARIGDGGLAPPSVADEGGSAYADCDDLLAASAAGERSFVCKFGSYDLNKVLRSIPRGRAEIEGIELVPPSKSIQERAARSSWRGKLGHILGDLDDPSPSIDDEVPQKRRLSTNFDTTNRTFRELMGNGLLYRVPPFQRDYAWTSEEWDDLWQDISPENGGEDRTPHYLGYLVLQSMDNKRFHIIDGQQRLTTISIIILAALDLIKGMVKRGVDAERNRKRLDSLQNSYIGYMDPVSLASIPKLELNRHNDDFYRNYLAALDRIPQRGLNASERRLRDAFEWFKERIGEEFGSEDGEKLAKFVDTLVDKPFFTVITVTDELNAFTVFETLNARGVRLSATDLLKNYLLSIISGDASSKEKVRRTETLEDRWERLMVLLGSESFPDFLRVYWNSRHKLVRKTQLFKTIRQRVTGRKAVFELLEDLDKYAEHYTRLLDPFDEIWDSKERESLEALSLFEIRQPLTLLIACYEYCKRSDFSRILRDIVIISFRYNVIGSLPPQDQERIYSEVAQKISKGSYTKYRDIIGALRHIYPDDKKFKTDFGEKKLCTTNSRNRRLARYLFLALEKNSSGLDLKPESATIEHILPENPSKNWATAIPESKQARMLYRLGNMAPLEGNENRKLGNDDYETKRKSYENSSFKITRTIAEDYDVWNEEKITARQQKLAKIAASVWRIEFDN
uniref:non-specific serine/threonine protein kinase n=1 Tax=Candidatus Kentrum sp. TUN TaxID=2126343 RepID=A0A451AH37_9GAMM|nr:MAG: Uncharacterized conserved protein, contains ParB-like and HNH nuclease domains [Candidatus Kentron sp. TUN]